MKILATLVATLLIAGCAGAPLSSSSGGGAEKLSASTLWARVTADGYTKTWKMWPGKGAFYKGSHPHGAFLTTYVNDVAYQAIVGKEGVMKPGAIVIKENYMPDKTLGATTIMWKVKGYNPEANDWFWAKYAPDGKVLKEGKVESCIRCHTGEALNDYLFTGSLK